ncbi:hypothetical protein P1J78_17355 [Psychromarinibacter sp. C21-152]|uniref:Outer membrane protein beta-barrel domain-containing protein n=1 Tax=Psychromarinibacter sediminicola TaxID=3033385 RepID=A0AAE3NQR9_9RHOB|nr:hypothetical protein [Psychromarinibacter sediminicola]MDF0602508.1 hypothetical protein [Psychromarinibacter sediminicola]
MKRTMSVVAAALLSVSSTAAAAQSADSAPFVLIPGAAASSAFSGDSTPYFVPTGIALGFGLFLNEYSMVDVATRETLFAQSPFYFDLTLYWRFATISALATAFQLGYYNQSGTVERVVQPGGATFATSGDMRDHGVFAGVRTELPLNGDPADDTGIKLSGALSLGYGWREFDAFGGGFTQEEDGLFWRAEAGLDIPLGDSRAVLNPGLIYTHFGGDDIEAENLVGAMRIRFDF